MPWHAFRFVSFQDSPPNVKRIIGWQWIELVDKDCGCGSAWGWRGLNEVKLRVKRPVLRLRLNPGPHVDYQLTGLYSLTSGFTPGTR